MSNEEPILSEEQELAIMLEAARRANWDALYGPRHLRTGRYRPSDVIHKSDTGDATDTPQPEVHEQDDESDSNSRPV